MKRLVLNALYLMAMWSLVITPVYGMTVEIGDDEAARIISASYYPKKESFAFRHPKLHKAGRRLRKTCQVMQPVVSVAANIAQITLPFLKR